MHACLHHTCTFGATLSPGDEEPAVPGTCKGRHILHVRKAPKQCFLLLVGVYAPPILYRYEAYEMIPQTQHDMIPENSTPHDRLKRLT